MLLASLIITIVVAVLVGLIVRKQVVNSLKEPERTENLSEPKFRPLFEPTDEELAEAEQAEAARIAELQDQERSRDLAEKEQVFDRLRQAWANSPDRPATIELLYQASERGQAELFWDICEQVLAVFRAGGIGGLSADDLAQMLESHFWLLPDSERTPGVSFRLKEEIAGLRRETAESK